MALGAKPERTFAQSEITGIFQAAIDGGHDYAIIVDVAKGFGISPDIFHISGVNA